MEHVSNLQTRWTSRFIELSMFDKSEKEKCNAFLYIIGKAGRYIFNAFVLTSKERDKVKILFEKFETTANQNAM